jgi:hypothetical protein
VCIHAARSCTNVSTRMMRPASYLKEKKDGAMAIRDKETCSMLPICPKCGFIPAIEHIHYNETWARGIWEGYIVECGCKNIVRGNMHAAIKEWFTYIGRNDMDISAKKEENTANIKQIGKEYSLPPAIMRELLSMNSEAYEQLEKATGYGKIMQELLLEYMPAAELKKKLNRKLLNISI